MILQLAGNLAMSWWPEHRWRRISVPLAVTLATICLLLSTSIWNLGERQRDRVESRSGVASTTDATSDLYVRPGLSKFDTRQYQVNWIAPAGNGQTVLPPGVATLPEPEVSFISPALAESREGDVTLQQQFPHIRLITEAGLADRGELLAWIRPMNDDSLASNPHVVRISSFGGAPGTAAYRFDLTNSFEPLPVAVVLLGLLVIPGGMILAIGVMATSSLRDRRVELLRLLGAGESWTLRLTLAELSIVALPTMLIVSGVWLILTRSITRLPIQEKQVIPGDLRLRWDQYGMVWLALSIAMALIVVVQQFWTKRPPRATRNQIPASGVSWIVTVTRFIPGAAGIGLAVYGGVRGGDTGGTYWMYGVSIVFASVPLALPLIGKPIGEFLSGLDHLSALLAGRRIERDPSGVLRPFLAIGVLAVIASIAFGVLAFLNDRDHWRPIDEAPSVVHVRWSDGGTNPADAVSLIQAKLPESLVVAASERTDGQGIMLAADCERIAAYLEYAAQAVCLDRSANRNPDRMDQDPLTRILRSGSVTFIPQAQMIESDLVQVVVFSHRPGVETSNALTGMLALPSYPSLTIASADGSGFMKTASSVWVESGMIVLMLVLGVAAFLSVIDRTIGAHTHRRLLLALGASSAQIRRLEALAFLVPYTAMVLLGVIVGAINVQAFRGVQGVPFPTQQLIALVVILAIAGVIGATAISYLGDPTSGDRSAGET